MVEKIYNGSYQEYSSIYDSNVIMTMRDGIKLSSDIFFPSLNGKKAPGPFPVVLERTPYDKTASRAHSKGNYFARRGYICVIQDVRGRFKSEGEWYAFADEAEDGHDTVEWLAKQDWCNGKIGTMGGSYAGSDQAALATLNPPHLSTMIIDVGASNYFHSSMRHNGTVEQRFLIYIFRMAASSKEALNDPGLRNELIRIYNEDMESIINKFPLREGTTILNRLPSYEKWAIDIQTHGEYSEYWHKRGYSPDKYYQEHADVPTLYLGGWYDSYARNTCESYIKLSKIKETDQFLLMGPWTHGQYEVTFSGDLDFGNDSQINFNDLKLSWFDKYMKDMYTSFSDGQPVRYFTMGGGDGNIKRDNPFTDELIHQGGIWKSSNDWPIPNTTFTNYYLNSNGKLLLDKPNKIDLEFSSFTFDPKDPVPTIGGGISAASGYIEPGGYNQVAGSRFVGSRDNLPLKSRHDVLSFETEVLNKEVEITGPIKIKLFISSSAIDTDFTAKLLDIHPVSDNYSSGLELNITDSIIRCRYRNGFVNPEFMIPNEIYSVEFELYPTSILIKKNHKIGLHISSSNWPRFDVNHNTGGSLGLDRDYIVANQKVYHSIQNPSYIVLPLQ
jgi:putative CocE/NonD family hydrolase